MIKKHEDVTRVADLISARCKGNITEEERAELDRWKNQSAENARLYDKYISTDFVARKFKFVRENDWNEAYWEFVKKTNEITRRRRRFIFYRCAAAVILFFMVGGAFYLAREREEVEVVQVQKIESGGCKAILTLADGEKINISDTSYLSYVEKAYQTISVTQKESYARDSVLYHTITIPRGGEYAFTLGDGSHVSMNAESEIRIPVHFDEHRREVYMTGEIFFDVVRNEKIPFVVHTRQGDVQVLGTSFNVRDYPDENFLAMTLVSGKIAFDGEGKHTYMKPGEQLRMDRASREITVEPVNVNLYCAWKDGRFVFEKQRLEEIMSMLARWYNINVSFENQAVKDVLFTGNIKRYGDWDQIVNLLKIMNKVDIEVNGSDVFIKVAK